MNPVLSKEIYQRFRGYIGVMILFLYLAFIGLFTLASIYVLWLDNKHTFILGENFAAFAILAIFQFIVLCFVIPGLTSGTVSGERERQTFDVLLITKLNTFQIIFGKVISSLAFIMLLLIATLPMYGLVLLLGGINLKQILLLFGFYFITSILFASIGIACSVSVNRVIVGTVCAYILTALVSLGSFVVGIFINILRDISISMDGTVNIEHSTYIYELLYSYLISINPISVLVAILGESTDMLTLPYLLPYWVTYTLFCAVISVSLLMYSIWRINPLK